MQYDHPDGQNEDDYADGNTDVEEAYNVTKTYETKIDDNYQLDDTTTTNCDPHLTNTVHIRNPKVKKMQTKRCGMRNNATQVNNKKCRITLRRRIVTEERKDSRVSKSETTKESLKLREGKKKEKLNVSAPGRITQSGKKNQCRGNYSRDDKHKLRKDYSPQGRYKGEEE